jgi:hypothetical protein
VTTMPAQDALLTAAEISMIFAGFSSILMVLRRRAEGWLPVELLALWLMVGFSLSALLFSFLPILLVQLGVSENAAWRASSAALGLLLLAWLVGVPAAARRMGAGAQAPRAPARQRLRPGRRAPSRPVPAGCRVAPGLGGRAAGRLRGAAARFSGR